MSKYDNDPWETRTRDEIDGVHWPAPEPMSPDDEQKMLEMAAAIGRNMGRVRGRIIASILLPGVEKH